MSIEVSTASYLQIFINKGHKQHKFIHILYQWQYEICSTYLDILPEILEVG